jgi:hypothetical protein
MKLTSPVALRLMPNAIGMQQSLPILRQLITGKEWHMRIGDVTDAIEE